MPFHPDGADVTLRTPAAGSSRATRNIWRNIEMHLAKAIGGKKVVRTSQVFAENDPGGTLVVGGRIPDPNIHPFEFLVMGVAHIAIDIPRTSQRSCKPKPRSLGIGAGEEARSWRGEFFVARRYRRMAKLVAQLNPCAQRPACEGTILLQVGVLGTGSGGEAWP